MWGDCKQVPAMNQERGLTRHHTTSAHTMTLDFPASETSLCCLKPSGLRHFVIAGRMNQDNDPSVTPCSAHLNQTFTITFLQSYSQASMSQGCVEYGDPGGRGETGQSVPVPIFHGPSAHRGFHKSSRHRKNLKEGLSNPRCLVWEMLSYTGGYLAC